MARTPPRDRGEASGGPAPLGRPAPERTSHQARLIDAIAARERERQPPHDYASWSAALERLLVDRRLVDGAQLDAAVREHAERFEHGAARAPTASSRG